MNWRYVDIFEVYTLHQLVIKRAKTRAEMRDFTLLHSAVERPRASFEGQELYPTLWLKAAALLQSLCFNHAFSDGNKRTAWAATHLFLWKNGKKLQAETKESVEFMLRVDREKLTIEEIAKWLEEHTEEKFKL